MQVAARVVSMNSDLEHRLATFLRLPESAEFMEFWTGCSGCVQEAVPHKYRLGLVGAMAILIVTRVAFRTLAVIFTQKLITEVNAGRSASAGADSVARSRH